MSDKLTEVLKVRITPSLLKDIKAEAEALKLRDADVIRVRLARRVTSQRAEGEPAAEAA